MATLILFKIFLALEVQLILKQRLFRKLLKLKLGGTYLINCISIIIREFEIVGRSDYMTLRNHFAMNFWTSIPESEDRRNSAMHPANLHRRLHTVESRQVQNLFSIYSYWSIRPQDYCSICQDKVSAVQAAMKIIVYKKVHRRKITSLSDSQVAIRALDSNLMKSNSLSNVW